jgi:hypothetical protein
MPGTCPGWGEDARRGGGERGHPLGLHGSADAAQRLCQGAAAQLALLVDSGQGPAGKPAVRVAATPGGDKPPRELQLRIPAPLILACSKATRSAWFCREGCGAETAAGAGPERWQRGAGGGGTRVEAAVSSERSLLALQRCARVLEGLALKPETLHQRPPSACRHPGCLQQRGRRGRGRGGGG